jgi:tetratricopeptide (TPR) repeat protein
VIADCLSFASVCVCSSSVHSHEQLLGRLQDRFAASQHGGKACVVSGSAGSGKTHLAERFLDSLPTSVPRLRGKGCQTGVAPLLPICEAIRSHEHGGNLDRLRAVAEEYARAIPLLEDVVDPPLRARSRAAAREVIPSETFTFVALSRLLASFEGQQTPVLFVDDIQWIDASSTAFLGWFAGQIHEHRVFLLLTRRLNGEVDERTQALLDTLHAGDHTLELSVDGLSRPEQLELIRTQLDGTVELDDEDLAWLETSSQAKPYYLRELVRLLCDRGDFVQDGAVWRLRERPQEAIIPPSLQRYVRQRILATEPRPVAGEVIQLAACIGTTFDSRIIADTLGEPLRRITGVLEQIAERTELIRRQARTSVFCFEHDLTREAVLAEVPKEMHERLAAGLVTRGAAPSLVAYQFEAAGNQASAATWYMDAASQALDDSHFQAAEQYARDADRLLAALGLPIHDDHRIAAAAAIGRALFGAERYPEVIDVLQPREARIDGIAAVPLRHLLGRAAARLPDVESHRRSVIHLRAALDALADGDEHGTRAAIWTDLVNSHDILGHHAESKAAYRTAIAAAKRANDSRALVRLMRLSCIFWQPEKVITTITRAVRMAKRLRLNHEIGLCENNLGCAYWAMSELDRAYDHFGRADEQLEQLGGYRRDTPLNNLGIVHVVKRELDRGRELLLQALAKTCDPHSELFISSNLAVVEAMAGDLAGSEARLRAAVATADETGDPFFRDCLRHNLANVLLELGRAEEAISVVRACPPHHSHGDESLVAAKRARLLVRALEMMGGHVPTSLRSQSALLDRTTKPQAWLYRMDWYLVDIEFWED